MGQTKDSGIQGGLHLYFCSKHWRVCWSRQNTAVLSEKLAACAMALMFKLLK